MKILEIDGSFGEGGGQIVRTAVTLSCILNKPIKIKNIRKGRTNSGLKPQHLSILKILNKVCDANLENVTIGSTYFQFVPKEMKNITLTEDVGTAGSVALIVQVLIPAAAGCKKKLKITIKGGTNVLWSPTIDYTQIILKELYGRMGIKFSLKGIHPIKLDRRKTKNVKIFCSFSKLPFELINSQIESFKEQLEKNNFSVQSKIIEEPAVDSGGFVLISSIDENSIIGIDSLFDKRTKKFDLDLDKFIKNNFSVDENLADMVVLPASIANGLTIFQVKKISKHLETNLFVASKITGCKYGIGKLSDGFEVRIEGKSNSRIK